MPKTAILVIDMLNDFLDRWSDEARSELIENTNALIDLGRKHGLPVIWVQQAFKSDLSDAFLEMRDKQIAVTIEGTRGADIHSDLDRRSGDPHILKKRYSAFFQTDLDSVLSDSGIDRLILAGVNTHACIRMAAIDAYQRDIRVIIATDCVASIDPEHHDVSLRYMRDKIALTRSNDEIATLLAEAI